jgi:hypothetical protein
MIPVPILSKQIGTVGHLRLGPCPKPSGGLGEGFGLWTERLFENDTVFGLGRTPKPSGSLFQGLDETVIKAPDDKLTHWALRSDINL